MLVNVLLEVFVVLNVCACLCTHVYTCVYMCIHGVYMHTGITICVTFTTQLQCIYTYAIHHNTRCHIKWLNLTLNNTVAIDPMVWRAPSFSRGDRDSSGV